ncbi:MerR family transcriptional regulator [Paenibacillus ottowii]|uniref:MerR family transcriptional regulator n=1 Tax=Paenibacillus ottowii TaxID=2315729 RepID=UPI003D322DFD
MGVSKTTISHWIKYFHEFIPKSKQGDIWVYGHETIKVLNRIKSLREELLSWSSIKKILIEEGYRIHNDDHD